MKTFAPLWIAAALAGCGPQTTGQSRGDYENENNGFDQKLTFDPVVKSSLTAVGDVSVIRVGHGNDGVEVCHTVSYPRTDIFGFPAGSYEGESCGPAAPASPVARIVSAECPTDGCTISISGTNVEVRTTKEGQHRFSVTVALSNGVTLSDSWAVAFTEVTELKVPCDYGICPGPNAVFPAPDRLFAIRPYARGKNGPPLPVKFSMEDNGVAAFQWGTQEGYEDRIWIQVKKPGTTTLTVTAGRLTWTYVLRVANPDDVRSGEVRLWNEEARAADIKDAQPLDLDPIGPVTNTLAHRMLLVWTLESGERVLDYGTSATTSTAGYYVSASEPFTGFGFYQVGGCVKGTVVASATRGKVSLSWPLENTCAD